MGIFIVIISLHCCKIYISFLTPCYQLTFVWKLLMLLFFILFYPNKTILLFKSQIVSNLLNFQRKSVQFIVLLQYVNYMCHSTLVMDRTCVSSRLWSCAGSAWRSRTRCLLTPISTCWGCLALFLRSSPTSRHLRRPRTTPGEWWMAMCRWQSQVSDNLEMCLLQAGQVEGTHNAPSSNTESSNNWDSTVECSFIMVLLLIMTKYSELVPKMKPICHPWSFPNPVVHLLFAGGCWFPDGHVHLDFKCLLRVPPNN